MMKKNLLLLVVVGIFGQSLSAMFPSSRRGGVAPEPKCVIPDGLRRVESNEHHDWNKMDAWMLTQSPRVRETYGIEAANPDFAVKLNEFVVEPVVEGLLRARASWDDAKLSEWLDAFKTALAPKGISLVSASRLTLELRFDAFPQYRVLSRLKAIPLGWYAVEPDGRPGYCCNPIPGNHFETSAFPFPLQLVSRILYAEEINAFVAAKGITNVRAAKHWLFEFPWHDADLDDENLFVIVESNFDVSAHADIVAGLKAEYPSYPKEALVALAADETNTSIMANLVRVISHSGLWNVKFDKQNPLFTVDTATGDCVAILCNNERPASGGGKADKFFHECMGERTDKPRDPETGLEEITSNAGIGLGSLVKLLASA